ncbi:MULTISPECIES: TIGR04149 family rSAM-modified RiPP [Flavobacterium]|jgi:natural product precursor|uniref:TIGR04149 family rSAM-modified RiPP n=1 Tax=Flavobacterium jumunjinense TaxID=998845 RepID=A0ABV5GRG6_9FLAO|nr:MULTISPECIES: TIGR04149 family rSAM-modified RiPP [Flavobacterium]
MKISLKTKLKLNKKAVIKLQNSEMVTLKGGGDSLSCRCMSCHKNSNLGIE